jgi:hypothetical protein
LVLFTTGSDRGEVVARVNDTDLASAPCWSELFFIATRSSCSGNKERERE